MSRNLQAMERRMSMENRNEQLQVLENVHEMLTEALKLAANEASVGLYYVQQHVHKAAPFLLRIQNQITDSMVGADLATEDMNDSLTSIKIMKECGPPVIERILKTLQNASNQIPTNRQSRGSFSQLLSKPARTLGLSKAPLRSSSFLGDWHKDSSTRKTWEDFEKQRSFADLRNKKSPGEKPALPFPDSKKADLSQKGITDSNQRGAAGTAGCDSSDALESNDPPSDGLKGVPTSDANPKVLARLGKAIQKAGSVSRGTVKSIANNVESQVVGDGRVMELKNWISGQGQLRFSRKTERVPKNAEGQLEPNEEIGDADDDYKRFQAERQAKLEAWLSQPDDTQSSSSNKDKEKGGDLPSL